MFVVCRLKSVLLSDVVVGGATAAAAAFALACGWGGGGKQLHSHTSVARQR